MQEVLEMVNFKYWHNSLIIKIRAQIGCFKHFSVSLCLLFDVVFSEYLVKRLLKKHLMMGIMKWNKGNDINFSQE